MSPTHAHEENSFQHSTCDAHCYNAYLRLFNETCSTKPKDKHNFKVHTVLSMHRPYALSTILTFSTMNLENGHTSHLHGK